MKNVWVSIRILIFLTLVTGVVYPLLVTAVGQVVFAQEANGSSLRRSGVAVGSSLVGQSFERETYFWGRPSGVGYNPLPSGGSNQGQASEALKSAYSDRLAKLKAAHPDMPGEPPQDLLFASGSGLDPHISPEAAQYQVGRVAKARGMTVQAVQEMVAQWSEGRQFGIFGEPRVNVLKLNLALDEAQDER